ncbi:MAG: nuclear transport factor 2 family protein [Gemmatimonadetes bacterium]|nr:nuclear transport factor 2 family protein [Gemmatimonadota bacterium]
MRSCRRNLVLVAISLLGGAPLAAQASRLSATDDASRVASVLRAVFDAQEQGNLAALDTLYAGDSLIIIEGTGVNRGWADYRDHHLAPELREMKNLAYRPADLEVHVAGNIAWVSFRYSLHANLNDRAVDSVGRGTAILERQATRWVVRHVQTAGRARRVSDPPAI